MRVRSCPKCGGDFVRVHRRIRDHLQSVIVPVRRYRCSSLECQYEANVPKTLSTKHKLALCFAGVLAATLAGALAMHGYVSPASHQSISSQEQGANVSPKAYPPDDPLVPSSASQPNAALPLR